MNTPILQFDMELSARLTLYELMLETLLAGVAANAPGGGKAGIQELRDYVLPRLSKCSLHGVTEEQRSEWHLNAQTISARLFDGIERRRVAILRGATTPKEL